MASDNPTGVKVYNPAVTGQQLMRLDDIFHIQVKIIRNYGDVSVEYGLSANYIAVNSAQLAEAYEDLRTIVENQHELALKNRPALMPTQLKDPQSIGHSTVFCTLVRKESIAGKDRIRLLGGEFSTHGIACYEEYFEKLEIDPSVLAYGDTAYNRHVLIQLDRNNNPKRAIQVVSGS